MVYIRLPLGHRGGAEHEKGRASSRMGEDATKSIIKARVLRGPGPTEIPLPRPPERLRRAPRVPDGISEGRPATIAGRRHRKILTKLERNNLYPIATIPRHESGKHDTNWGQKPRTAPPQFP